MPSPRVIAVKTQLDRLLDSADLDGEVSPTEKAVFDEATRNFRNGGPGLVDEATPFMWVYYKSFVSFFSPSERVEYGLPEIPDTADIWQEVDFRHPPTLAMGDRRFEPGRSYISFEGEVSWEREHGLQLVFEHGLRVCKVGPYDGHHTNAHAYADETLLGVIFKA